MSQFYKKIKQTDGTSLLELLVAVSLFTVVILASTQIFKMVLDGQRNSVSANNVQENIRYVMEKMSKEIRVAKISDHNCEQLFSPKAAAVNKVYNIASIAGLSNDVLYFKNKDDICVAYYLDSATNRLKITVDVRGSGITDFVTPDNVRVSNLKFYVEDDLIDSFHSVQPYVVMTMEINAVGQAINQQKMKVQTTISSRYYE